MSIFISIAAYRDHWDDHVKKKGVDVEWHQRERLSVEKVKQFLMAPTLGPFGWSPPWIVPLC